MRFAPALFDQHLTLKRQMLAWRRASLCPCREPHSGAADPNCPTCEGRGVFWGVPRTTFAAAPGAAARRQFADFGRWEDGDIVLSVPATSALWDAGENDRVTLLQGHEQFQVRLVRTGTERLNFDAERIDRCFWLRPGDGAVIEASLPRLDAETRFLSWPDADHAPDPGAQFTLAGRRRPEFFIYRDLPMTRAHFDGQPLPKRMLLKKFDLFGA